MNEVEYIKKVESEIEEEIRKAEETAEKKIKAEGAMRDKIINEKTKEARSRVKHITDVETRNAEDEVKGMEKSFEEGLREVRKMSGEGIDRTVDLIIKELTE